MSSLYRRIASYAERYFHADTPDGDLTTGGSIGEYDGWADLDARRARYALMWASYQNTTYRDIHRWARSYRQETGLYKFARSIYNPTARLVEFHASHIHGGRLDPEAGDGSEKPSALPIVTENEAIRPAIGQVWRDSRWERRKAIWVRNGALNGDTIIKVCHDPSRGKVCLDLVHPKHLKWVETDPYGNVKAYVIEKRVPDPRRTKPTPGRSQREDTHNRIVTFEEHCSREGDAVIFSTWLIDGGNAIPWDWRDYPVNAIVSERVGPEWVVPYGFVPLVLTQHIDMGLDFGLSEAHCELPKIREADDAASLLHDAIRKSVRPGWLYSGMARPTSTASNPDGRLRHPRSSDYDEDTGLSSETERQEVPIVYAKDPAAKAMPLVASLQLSDALAVLKDQVEEIERDFPELRFDRMRSEGSFPSGEALRIARQPTQTKIEDRRATYDADLVKAHMMALAIGGHHYREDRDPRLEAFAPFSLDSYRDGALDHSIGERPVFAVDPALQDAERMAKYAAIEVGIRAGLPKRRVWLEAGYSEADVAEMEAEAEADAEAAMERMRQEQAIAGVMGPEDEDEVPPDDEDEDDDG